MYVLTATQEVMRLRLFIWLEICLEKAKGLPLCPRQSFYFVLSWLYPVFHLYTAPDDHYKTSPASQGIIEQLFSHNPSPSPHPSIMHLTALLPFATLPATILSLTHDISVAQNGLSYSPNNIQAATGDTLTFHFLSAPHSVAQSTFDKPCQPSSGGVWSGVVSDSGPTVRRNSTQEHRSVWKEER